MRTRSLSKRTMNPPDEGNEETPKTVREETPDKISEETEDVILERVISGKESAHAGCHNQNDQPQRDSLECTEVDKSLCRQISKVLNLIMESARNLFVLRKLIMTSYEDIDHPHALDTNLDLLSETNQTCETPIHCSTDKNDLLASEFKKVASTNRDVLDKSAAQFGDQDTDDLIIEYETQSDKPIQQAQEMGESDLLLSRYLSSLDKGSKYKTKPTKDKRSCSAPVKRRPYTRKPYTPKSTNLRKRGKQLSNPCDTLEGAEHTTAGKKTPSDINQPQLIAYISPYHVPNYPFQSDPISKGELNGMHTLCHVWPQRTRVDTNGYANPENALNMKQPGNRMESLKDFSPSNILQRKSDLVNTELIREGRQQTVPSALFAVPSSPTDTASHKNVCMLFQNRIAAESAQPFGFYNRYQVPFFPANPGERGFSNEIHNHPVTTDPITVNSSGRPNFFARSNPLSECPPVYRQMLQPAELYNGMEKYAVAMKMVKNNHS